MHFISFITLAILVKIIPGKLIDPRLQIDWNKVIHIQDLPGFWDNRDIKFVPAKSNKIGRVVGGELASPGQFPWQAALVLDFESDHILCGGSVITDSVILSAAHCLTGAVSAIVILGAYNFTQVEEGQTTIFVPKQNFIIHRLYNPRLFEQDIATIICPRFSFTPLIQPIPLTTDRENLMVGEIATVSGFGRYSDSHYNRSDVIRFASMRVITNEECEQTFGAMVKSQLCCSGEGGRSPCNSDSGGPLTVIQNNVTILAGIVSFGSSSGCEVEKPSAYTRVTYFDNWINQNLVL